MSEHERKNMRLKEREAQKILDARPHDHFNFRKDSKLIQKLAKKYRISPSTITRIWRRKAWAHLERTRKDGEE